MGKRIIQRKRKAIVPMRRGTIPVGGGGVHKPRLPRPKKARLKKNPVRPILRRKCKQELVVVSAVLSTCLLKTIKGRPDAALLKAHILAILVQKKKYEIQKSAAIAKLIRGNASDATRVPHAKRKITEATGEYEATNFVVQQRPGFLIKWMFAPGTGFDQLWYNRTTDTYLIVEAKGPGAVLETEANKGPQMSRQWVLATLDEVIASKLSSKADVADAKRMKVAILTKTTPPHVQGLVVQAKIGGGGQPLGCPDNGQYT